ncbi:vacuolar protein 14 C-terminal Fig4p binding-domain-containing protein [Obelidium mucronatum]|nr:vacuolar protein 14 C-terminal Fig4p binding-domain-containing protein [Obelidium mucronatum]
MADVLGPVLSRQLQEKLYDKRKLAALEVERLVRDAAAARNAPRVAALIRCVVFDFAYAPLPNARNGGLIALAAVAIALGAALGDHLNTIIPPILACFSDPDCRVRYYACESMYNVAKVARRDLLVFFNEIFDALSRLVADQDGSVKNGAELLDRLIKDIVCEHAEFVASSGGNAGVPSSKLPPSEPAFPAAPGSVPLPVDVHPTTFNFPRFIPLLAERIKTMNPFTRMFLIQWITTLDAIPFLELVSFLPEFLDGLFTYVSDSNMDVRTAVLVLLAEFLKEIRDILRGSAGVDQRKRSGSTANDNSTIKENEALVPPHANFLHKSNSSPDFDEEPVVRRPISSLSLASAFFAETGKASTKTPSTAIINTTSPVVPGSSSHPYQTQANAPPITLDFSKIIKILLPYLSSNDSETQATALRWINEFVQTVPARVIVPFTPGLVSAILPCLSQDRVTPIKHMAVDVNAGLYRLVAEHAFVGGNIGGNGEAVSIQHKGSTISLTGSQSDSFDVGGAVEALTRQFRNEHEETRVASMDWLLMLHKKAPNKVVGSEDVLFQTLLKLLSDTSEEVVKKDLQLLAQISISSDDEYFHRFLVNLLDVFSLDRKLLESRGSLIIRHLCLSLNPERMFRAFADILERDDDLEFASTMVQNLNIILVTAPELSELRRRLKNLDSREGLLLFAVLYRCWCHNPISTFTLCLLSQAYEHAASLLPLFSELEITVQFLIQVDKLVQLIESPVFTYLRLQLLEPEKYPYLFKCLFGVLMLLPQSSAFATLRNRLSSVSSMVMLYGVNGGSAAAVLNGGGGGGIGGSGGISSAAQRSRPKSNVGSGNGLDVSLKWNELLTHFRNVQNRHERNRRLG